MPYDYCHEAQIDGLMAHAPTLSTKSLSKFRFDYWHGMASRSRQRLEQVELTYSLPFYYYSSEGANL